MDLHLLRLGIALCGIVFFINYCMVSARPKHTKKDLEILREEVRQMFQHAYDSYLKYAYPYDELRPLSCDGVDTWGSYSLTLIDALDTLAVMGNYTEFQRVVNLITSRANFDANINVSVFETNIRIIGGLLSAHLLSYKAGVEVDPGWPCNGPLLQLAEDVARRLLSAFDTTTGMPYGTVNLRYGVPEGETSVTCTAGVAMNALHALYNHRSPIGLVGNHIDVQTGRWTAQDAGIGAGVDSYYEYLVKGAILLKKPELMHMFHEQRIAIDKYLKRDDWHLWVSMSKGQVTLPVFQSLEAYWPGVLSLIGDIDKGMKSLHNYHQVWKQYGFTPEFYNIPQGEVGANRESYPLRPELVESVMYLYRATGDPYLLEVGKDILRSIQHSAKTPCGYATIKDVRDHRKEDRMESFFLAETTKYLYLLFDPDNFIHNRGQHGTIMQRPWGECILYAGGYVFNTEAHPIDPGALHCCSGHRQSDILLTLHKKGGKMFQGDPLSTYRHSRRNPSFHSKTLTESSPRALESKENCQESKEFDIIEKEETKKTSEYKLRKIMGSEHFEENVQLQVTSGTTVNVDAVSEDDSVRPINSMKIQEGTNKAEKTSGTDTGNLGLNLLPNDRSIESESILTKGEQNNPPRNNDLEYRADDSDWVYSVTDKDRELEIDTDSESIISAEEKQKESIDAKVLSVKSHEVFPLPDENIKDKQPQTMSSYIGDLLSPKSKGPVDHQLLLERLQSENKYKRNTTWEKDFAILSCSCQPFLQRLSMSGEIFGVV